MNISEGKLVDVNIEKGTFIIPSGKYEVVLKK